MIITNYIGKIFITVWIFHRLSFGINSNRILVLQKSMYQRDRGQIFYIEFLKLIYWSLLLWYVTLALKFWLVTQSLLWTFTLCFLFFFVVFFLFIITAARIHSNSLSLSINFEQNVGDKFTNLSKMGFSMERFTDDFLQFLPKSVKNWLLGRRLGTRHQIQVL